jgi:SAM-dependent methyltransferase
MNLIDLTTITPIPQPWAEGDQIPWNDPGFSERMLPFHFPQDHDSASRRSDKIDAHVAWLHSQLLCGQPSKILDLGCGPGHYASRLARLGHTVTGVDFSPASIRYARESAARESLACTYVFEDMRKADYGSGYDLAMQIYGEINVFRPADANRIVKKAYDALVKGGLLLLEVQTEEGVRKYGAGGQSWQAAASSLFSGQPHLLLKESFWDEATHTATERYHLVDAASAQVTRYAITYLAYTDSEYEALLTRQGFEDVQFYPSLGGSLGDPRQEFFVITGRKTA